MSQRDFTVCVLLYGDYPDLARRVLAPIVQHCPMGRIDLRIALNEVSIRTQAVVNELLIAPGFIKAEDLYTSDKNVYKYPMMRRMIHDPDNPITSPYVIWFDDDSYIHEGASRVSPWLDRVMAAMGTPADMLGAVYNMRLGGNQHLWILDQPWYNGVPVPAKQKTSFATGGWWCIRTAILQRFDWPVPQIRHRGGDVMLGQLIQQQGLSLVNFRDHLAINADGQGTESKATRRGFDEKPIGYNYEPGPMHQVAVLEPPNAQAVEPPPPRPVLTGPHVSGTHTDGRATDGHKPPTQYFNPGL